MAKRSAPAAEVPVIDELLRRIGEEAARARPPLALQLLPRSEGAWPGLSVRAPGLEAELHLHAMGLLPDGVLVAFDRVAIDEARWHVQLESMAPGAGPTDLPLDLACCSSLEAAVRAVLLWHRQGGVFQVRSADRPPPPGELARLDLATAHRQRLSVPPAAVVDDFSRQELPLRVEAPERAGSAGSRVLIDEQARLELADDLEHLDATRLARHFPLEAGGRLPLGLTVALCSHGPDVPGIQGARRAWLCACSPRRRSDPQQITLRLIALLGDTCPDRWDRARWLWDDRVASCPAELWGGLTPAELGPGSPPAGPASEMARRTRRTLELLDEGDLVTAFGLHGIALGPALRRALEGQPLSRSNFHRADSWGPELQKRLWAAAPWRFGQLLEPLTGRVHQEAGRRKAAPAPWFRLFGLSGQKQSRKAALVLVGPASARQVGDTVGTLDIEETARMDRLASVLWCRPVSMDLCRFGLIDPSSVTLDVSPSARSPTPSLTAEQATQVSPLLADLDDAAPQVRQRALEALGQLGVFATLPAVARAALRDPDPAARMAAQDAVAAWGGRSLDDSLAELGRSEDPLVGRAALALARERERSLR